ncbi:hypothetical protein NIES267_44170 [Calothrix parasitica NIES-267]|uniref:Uncharacterized protein n=1 Tax=Calothrix parasitica NIES-267 TaxID=1973488 RepID=A0A1Z4LUM2_9CYAN|nr:hypothetical protein NIES267_44170 [Calothrix parasitica NIES-267]
MSEAGEVKVTDTTDKDSKGSAFSKFKKILIGIVIATIAGAALYGAGWFQARSQFSSDDEPLKRELQQTKEQLITERNRTYLMEARGDLYDTAVNLDERNFGMANTRLQEAAAALGKVEDTDDNLNISKIQELQKAVAKKNINVAVNLEQQRNTVLSYINVLNKLIPTEEKLEIPAAKEAPQQ